MTVNTSRFIPKTKAKKVLRDTEIKTAVKFVQNNKYKIVLVKTEVFPFTMTHICKTKIDNKQTPLIWMISLLDRIARIHKNEQLFNYNPITSKLPFTPAKKESYTKTDKDGKIVPGIPFPVSLNEELTIKDYQKYLHEELDSFISSHKLDSNYKSIIGILNTHKLFGQTFIDFESETKLLKAILELSKNHIIIMANPMNTYDLPPTEVLPRVHFLKSKNIPPTPYNTAHVSTQDVADKIIGNSVLIILKGLK